jgi:thymidine kinase
MMDSYFTSPSSGFVELVCGCMFSGKTEEMIKLIKRAQFAKKKIQIFKPYLDNRYKIDFIVSHSNLKLPCHVVEDSSEIKEQIKPETEVVAIDEVQFFDERIVSLVQELADNGMHVICAGLDTDWRGEPFHPIPLIMATADVVRKQYAVCTVCGAPATRTQRTIPSEESILVGSGEIYQARCRMHFDPKEVSVGTSKKKNLEV